MSRGKIRVERTGLTKFGDGFRISLQLGIGNTEVEVGQGVRGPCRDNLFEQRNGSGVIFAIERVLSLGKERGDRVAFRIRLFSGLLIWRLIWGGGLPTCRLRARR